VLLKKSLVTDEKTKDGGLVILGRLNSGFALTKITKMEKSSNFKIVVEKD
jgi:hypothetical protein